MSDETPAASHSVGASHLSLVTLELRGQSRNSLLQLAALPLDRHEAGVCSQQLLSDRGEPITPGQPTQEFAVTRWDEETGPITVDALTIRAVA